MQQNNRQPRVPNTDETISIEHSSAETVLKKQVVICIKIKIFRMG